jgi:hypothetical protein
MNQRSTYILLGVFAGLAVIAYFLASPSDERIASYSIEHVNLNMDSAKIQSVTITKPNSTFSLENIGGKWYVTKAEPAEWRYPADETTVKNLLGSIQKLKITSMVSSNPDRQHLFQVDSTGTLLSFADRGGNSISFYVGKMGPSFSETYVRPANSNDVFLAEGLTSWEVNKEMKEWRDKVIVKVERDSVRRLTFRYQKSQFTLIKDSVWSIQPPVKTSKIDETIVTSLLGSLESLKAAEFVDSTIKLPPPQLTLDLTMPEAVTMYFIPIPPDSSKYWVRTSTTEQTFTANKWSVQPLLKQRNDFLQK